MRKDSIIFVSMSIFKLIYLWSNRLEFFRQISIDMFLVKFGWCVKTIFCLFDHLFIRHIDWKDRSATAPFVSALLLTFKKALLISSQIVLIFVIYFLNIFKEMFSRNTEQN